MSSTILHATQDACASGIQSRQAHASAPCAAVYILLHWSTTQAATRTHGEALGSQLAG